MTIDEAIELLSRINKSFQMPPDALIQDAIKLGIEALKAWRDKRQFSNRYAYHLLPGETEE